MAEEKSYLFAVTVDIDPAKEEEWNDWYNNVHVPDVLRCPGFLNCRRYRVVSGKMPRYLAVYEVESPNVMESELFRSIRGWHQFKDDVIDPRPTIYEQILAVDPGAPAEGPLHS